MMSSSFFPFENESECLKISSSVQEWCGMTYLEMKNENDFIFDFHSYFEGQNFDNLAVKKDIMEDDLWSLIRLNPELLPVGNHNIIPSVTFLYLGHVPPKAYDAVASLDKKNGKYHYKLKYPELDREFTVMFNVEFPHEVTGWEDTHYSGFGPNRKILTSKAEAIKTIKTDYWSKHAKKDTHLRAKLGLE